MKNSAGCEIPTKMRFSTQVIPFNLIINVLATEANPPATIPQQNILLTRRYNYVLSHKQAAEVGGGSEVLILSCPVLIFVLKKSVTSFVVSISECEVILRIIDIHITQYLNEELHSSTGPVRFLR